MNQKELTGLVEDAVDLAIGAGEIVSKTWLTQRIVSEQIALSDSDFARVCAYHAVSDIVGSIIRKTKRDEESEDDGQLVLDGFERLQRCYAIDRDGPCIVPIEQMTLIELRAKAAELRSLATGALAHARELEAYIDQRTAQAAE
jgi:hypothetical protein